MNALNPMRPEGSPLPAAGDAPMRGGLVLGSARCGSTLVSQVLRLHPDVLSLSELFSTAGPHAFRPARPGATISGARFWQRLATPSRALSRMGNPALAPAEFLYGRQPSPAFDPFFCPPVLAVTLPHLSDDPDALFQRIGARAALRPDLPLADHYRALFADLAGDAGGKVWVERSGGSLAAAGTLRAMFPEARPVLLLRDGPDTALSMRDYPAARLAIWMWRRLRPLGIDLLGQRSHYGRGALWPAISAIGGRIGVGAILSRRPSLKDCGAFWSAVTLAGLRGLDGAKPLVLHYEDLCRQPRSQLVRLGIYLTGRAPADWLDAASALPRPRPSRAAALPEADRRVLLNACERGEFALAAAGMARRAA